MDKSQNNNNNNNYKKRKAFFSKSAKVDPNKIRMVQLMIYITSEFEKVNLDICDDLIKEFITNEKPKKNS